MLSDADSNDQQTLEAVPLDVVNLISNKLKSRRTPLIFMRNHLADCALRERSLSCHLATYRVYHTQPAIFGSTWTFGKSRNAMFNQLSSRHHSILSVCIDDVKAEQKQERQIEISGILACADLLPHPLIFAQHTKANLKSSSRREHLSSINFQCAN